jgi:membrane-bound lytic murein transglycosylase D
MRRMRHALLCLTLLAAAACVHTPAMRPASPAAAMVVPPAAPPAEPVPAPLPTPVPTTSRAAPGDTSGAAPAESAPAAAIGPPAPPAPPPSVPTVTTETSTTASAGAPSAESASTPPTEPSVTATTPASAPESAPAASAPPSGPEQFADLFDRMRAGFKLGDEGDHHAVDVQVRWYAGNPDYLQRAFGRADLYLYYIITQLEARNMPLELALLPVVESAFEPYAYSRARATGLWQFIPGTGSRFGLKQDWWYDGRRDIVESTRAALDYLKSLHDEFNGDWLLAIAAYNCGELNIERSVAMNRAAGRPIDFWNLWLPRETRAYVPKLLAMRRLVIDPEAYGLEISAIANRPYFARVATGGQINLKLAAEIAGIAPDELYELNPAFHRFATDPAGPHYLLVPADAAEVFTQNITELTPDQRLGVTHYTVRRGDSLANIARRFHTTVSVVRELNELPKGRLTVGDDIRLPETAPELPEKVMLAAARADGHGRFRPHVQVVRRGDSLWTIARRNGMSVTRLAMLNGLHPGDTLRAGQRIRVSGGGSTSPRHARHHRRVIYTVRHGDTVAQIAELFQCSVPQILAWNGLSSHSRIHAGQKLRIRVIRHI